MTKRARRNQGWRDYWKEDRSASCVAVSPATQDAIREHWAGIFAELADGCRILDVATGNGVVLAHAAIAAGRAGRQFALTGVDLADIDPVRYVSGLPEELRDATFLGGTGAEELPFADGSFDIVVSQYGLEYADLDKAIDEVARVLVAGGWLHWLAHSPGSDVVDQNRGQSREVELLLAPDSPLAAMQAVVAKIKKGKGVQQAMTKLAASLRKAEQYCEQHPPAKVIVEVCTRIAEVAQRWQAYYPEDIEKMLDDGRLRLIAHRQRINDLNAAVVTPEREDLIRGGLTAPDWDSCSLTPLRIGANSSPIGTMIQARRC